MKSEFKAKYLQHLVSKKKGNEGFTLIELLVVIIIVGVLAAIALPSFLNQIGKARGSEAKSNLGTINRSQQAYRLERNTFSNALTALDARVTGKFYSYTVAGAANTATAVTTPVAAAGGGDLKVSSAYVRQNGDTFLQIICESTETSAAVAVAPTDETACAANYVQVN
ncbi:MAG: prepilin-type N-terminal cleavage/methylation domain-containing protein [Thermosynechococcaceae cyanobacterium MS004]|nr:prepilin-type N-terminal cleavage/methylation domain-containing protein [Thermosynechococcaceae cyanobacterium MS004]